MSFVSKDSDCSIHTLAKYTNKTIGYSRCKLNLKNVAIRVFCIIGRIERNEDNAGESARTRASQVNVGGTHTNTRLTHGLVVNSQPPLSTGCTTCYQLSTLFVLYSEQFFYYSRFRWQVFYFVIEIEFDKRFCNRPKWLL